MSQPIKNRYDFVYLYDVKDGNPNGDPDQGNLPRADAENQDGLVSDVCIKRKVRNYMTLKNELKSPYDIFIRQGVKYLNVMTIFGKRRSVKMSKVKFLIFRDQ